MQNKNKIINKLALVLISIIILELVLIGDQVQPVKTLKHKMFLKKIKKIIPMLALFKPKKKIILVPIPIPMFNQPGAQGLPRPYSKPQKYVPTSGVTGSGLPTTYIMMSDMSSLQSPGAMSFKMIENPLSRPLQGSSLGQLYSSSQQPVQLNDPIMMINQPISSQSSKSMQPQQPISSMNMPTMTMTYQSEPGGISAMKLSTNIGTNQSGALVVHSPLRDQLLQPVQHHHPQQQLQLQKQRQQPLNLQIEQIHEDSPPFGDEYYYSPWISSKQVPASPVKVYRHERLREKQPVEGDQLNQLNSLQPSKGRDQMERQVEEVSLDGRPQMLRVYPVADGHLHLPPPVAPRSTALLERDRASAKLEASKAEFSSEDQLSDEVQIVVKPQPIKLAPRKQGNLSENQERSSKLVTRSTNPTSASASAKAAAGQY